MSFCSEPLDLAQIARSHCWHEVLKTFRLSPDCQYISSFVLSGSCLVLRPRLVFNNQRNSAGYRLFLARRGKMSPIQIRRARHCCPLASCRRHVAPTLFGDVQHGKEDSALDSYPSITKYRASPPIFCLDVYCTLSRIEMASFQTADGTFKSSHWSFFDQAS